MGAHGSGVQLQPLAQGLWGRERQVGQGSPLPRPFLRALDGAASEGDQAGSCGEKRRNDRKLLLSEQENWVRSPKSWSQPCHLEYESAHFSECYFIPPVSKERPFSPELEGLAGRRRALCRSGSGTQRGWVESVAAVSGKTPLPEGEHHAESRKAYIRQAWKWGVVLMRGGRGRGAGSWVLMTRGPVPLSKDLGCDPTGGGGWWRGRC